MTTRRAGRMRMRVTLPIRAVSVANLREHWATKAKRAKTQRNAAYLLCPRSPLPCVVTMTRIGVRLLDDDNLRSALKNVRDGIADKLGVQDNDPRVVWKYAQRKGKPYAVEVDVVTRARRIGD